MPISATSNHSESHWKDVLKLLHRVISNSGFEPVNVWESSSGDRISERIIGNIFNLDIAVVDISDLNENVMFELGLRLSSKKPTVVICNNGGLIPFDIRDFEVVFYPSDLNILGIEEFFAKLEKQIREKYNNFSSDSYSAFLSNVIVDVASPQTREVGFNDLVLSRLDDLGRKISSFESKSQQRIRTRAPAQIGFGTLYIDIPEENFLEFMNKVGSLPDVHSLTELKTRNGMKEVKVDFSSSDLRDSELRIMAIASDLGGEEGLPF